MSPLRAAFFCSVTFALLACGKDDDSTKATPVPASQNSPPLATSRFAATGWPEDAGPVVVLPGSTHDEVRLVLPDLTDNTLSDTSSFELDSLPNSAISLFSPGRSPVPVTVVAGESEESPRGCKTWPTARISAYPGDGWKVGLAAGAAGPLPLSGWGPALMNDSSEAAREVVSMAAFSRTDSTFRGVPFGIRFLYRIELGSSRVIIADALRRINTEANVREEHVLLIAERQRGEKEYALAFRETQRGREDEVRVPEILSAVLLGENRRPAIFASLEYSEGARLLLVERLSASKWVLRWRSAYAGC